MISKWLFALSAVLACAFCGGAEWSGAAAARPVDSKVTPSPTPAAPQWDALLIGTANSDTGIAALPLTGGRLLLTGDTTAANGDRFLLEIGAQGQIPWAIRIDHANPLHGAGVNDVAQLPDGSFYMTSFQDGGDIKVYKFAPDGTRLSENKYVPPAELRFAASSTLAADGGLVVAGSIRYALPVGNDGFLLKINQLGNVDWARRVHDYEADELVGVTAAPDGGFVACGRFANGPTECSILKCTANGSLTWRLRAAASPGYSLYSQHVCSANDVYSVIGFANGFAPGWDAVWLNVSSAGQLLSATRIGGLGSEILIGQVILADGSMVGVGYTNSAGNGDNDGFIVKLDSTGALQWARTYGGEGADYLWQISQLPSGGFAVAGHSASAGSAGAEDAFVLHTDEYGRVPGCQLMRDWTPTVEPVSFTVNTNLPTWAAVTFTRSADSSVIATWQPAVSNPCQEEATPTPTWVPTGTPTPEPTAEPTPVPGDVNGDGQVTPGDAQLVFSFYLDCAEAAPTFEQYAAANYCGPETVSVCDGTVTPADAQGIMRWYLGISDPCAKSLSRIKFTIPHRDSEAKSCSSIRHELHVRLT